MFEKTIIFLAKCTDNWFCKNDKIKFEIGQEYLKHYCHWSPWKKNHNGVGPEIVR